MDDKPKNNIWKTICVILVFITIFLVVCIVGLRKRADDLQTQLDQCVKIEEQSLNPCPICGHEVKLNPINDSFYIECGDFLGENGCGLKTGYYKSKNELIEQWNGMNK